MFLKNSHHTSYIYKSNWEDYENNVVLIKLKCIFKGEWHNQSKNLFLIFSLPWWSCGTILLACVTIFFLRLTEMLNANFWWWLVKQEALRRLIFDIPQRENV